MKKYRRIYNAIILHSNKIQKKSIDWLLVEAISTGILAFFAIVAAILAIKAFNLQSESIKLQSKAIDMQFEYYKKTTRPFVYVDDVSIIYQDNDSLMVNVEIQLKNVGKLPATNIALNYPFVSEPNKIWLTIPIEDIGIKNFKSLKAVFPEQGMNAYFYNEFQPMEVLSKKIRECKYLQIIVIYSGLDNERYVYITVMEINEKDLTFTKNSRLTRSN